MVSFFGTGKKSKGANQATAGGNDDFRTKQQGPRNPEELDALWTQTRLPQKYRANIPDDELEAMASQAEQEGRPLRSVVEDNVRQQKAEQEVKEFDEMDEHHHTFFTATHRKGFNWNPLPIVMGLIWMTIAPWLLFLGIGVLLIYLYYSLPWITLLIVLIVGALSCLMLLTGAMSNNLNRLFLGILFLIATVAGFFAGIENYNERLFHYWTANEGRQYTNVRSDSLAAAHADAGVLVFTDEAVVDTTKTIGYKSGSVYCVAPISRKDQTHASTIQYWAAGVDCCNGRGFFSCDNALDKAAKSGLVIREQPTSALFKSELDYYLHAVEMSSEIYGLTTAKEPFFVRWTTDVTAKAESYLIDGWMHWGYYGIAHLVCNFVLACLFKGVISQQNSKANNKKDSDNFATGKDETQPLTKGPGAYRKDQQRWQSLDVPQQDYDESRLEKGDDKWLRSLENDTRGIDTTTMPVSGQQRADNYERLDVPTPTFSSGLDKSNDSVGTRYEPHGYGNQGYGQRV